MSDKLQGLISMIQQGVTDEVILKKYIVDYIATQEDVVPYILQILATERETKKDLLQEMNFQLSRNTVCIQEWNTSVADEKQRGFYLEETRLFYEKYKGEIAPCFGPIKYDPSKAVDTHDNSQVVAEFTNVKYSDAINYVNRGRAIKRGRMGWWRQDLNSMDSISNDTDKDDWDVSYEYRFIKKYTND